MAEIFQNDFSLGWRPSDDLINGAKNCLLRMQNLKLDEVGALTQTPGSLKISSLLSSAPHTLYSKILSGTLFRFLCDTAGRMLVDTGHNGGYATDVKLSAGSTVKAAYGSAYNYVLMCSGTQKLKYDPAVNTTGATAIGPKAPTVKPTVALHAAYTVDLTGTPSGYTALTGTVGVSSGFVQVTVDTDTLNGVANYIYSSAIDSTSLSSGSAMTPDDLFSMDFQSDDPTQIQTITVIFKDATDLKSYFEFTFDNTGDQLITNMGPNVTAKLQCHRGDFDVLGVPNWANIKQIVVSVVNVSNSTSTFYFNNILFSGGSLGGLSGTIEYCQVNLQIRSGFTARGPRSAITTITTNQQSSTITPQDPTTADVYNNGWEIYRRGGGLDQFYLIKSGGNTFAAFDDTLDDTTALDIGIALNERTARIADISDDILEIVGPFFNRTLYFTAKAIYISFDGNPECYDSGEGVATPYGSSGEFFLWATKFGNSAILVGTTNDIYEVTGTFSELPDGTVDATIRPTGCKNPPINDAHSSTANELYYIASDGPRVVNPSGNAPLNDALDLLFKKKDRYGFVAPKINAGNVDKFIFTISKNELYLSLVDTNGLRKMVTFDLLKKYWYEYKIDNGGFSAPTALFTEEDGTLTAGFSDSPNLYVRALNIGTLVDGTGNQLVFLRTKVFNDNTPRQRKDSYTFKCKLNTGNAGIEFRCYLDESSTYISLGFISTPNLQEITIDVSSLLGVCHSYQIEINGNCPAFKLVDFSIDYDPRPIPISYFRSQPTNYGVVGRKRIYELPVTIDTISSPCILTPYLDNVAQAPLHIETTNKATINYNFPFGAICTDLFYTIIANGGYTVFEYYGDVQPRVIEALPDAVTNYIIPNTNLGSYCRKRFIAFAFVINTNGANVVFTPSVDGVYLAPLNINTNDKLTVIYYFTVRTEGVDIGGKLASSGTTPFEYYDEALSDCISEKLPPSAVFFVIPPTNLGSYARKRFIAFAFVINTRGQNVVFTPTIDNVARAGIVLNTNDKQTYIYYFDVRTEGIDIGGTLQSASGGAFEYYGVLLEECISEKLPASATYLVIPFNNLGTYARKRLIAFAFVINTKGQNVTFIPIIDNISFPPVNVVTTDKRTFIYYFNQRVEGIDIGGTLHSTANVPFEFYGVSIEECVSEKLPPSATFLVIPTNNFGAANRKRIRTIPLVINTKGNIVTFTPFIDGTAFQPTNFQTTDKTTVLHYFTTDAFGIDLGGTLASTGNFEFYGMPTPENVEILPVAKKFDQVGPTEFNRNANIKAFRARLIALGNSVHYDLFVDDILRDSGDWDTLPNIDKVYEFPWVRKFLNGTTCRIELSSNLPFHRLSAMLRINVTGSNTDGKWLKMA